VKRGDSFVVVVVVVSSVTHSWTEEFSGLDVVPAVMISLKLSFLLRSQFPGISAHHGLCVE